MSSGLTLKQVGVVFEVRDGDKYIGYVEPGVAGHWRAIPASPRALVSVLYRTQAEALGYLTGAALVGRCKQYRTRT